ncbi:MAG: HDOD domain-containing protein [Halieaceae bacterium]|nr:HDOD domain-containing protein [Halieaceae bacterium]
MTMTPESLVESTTELTSFPDVAFRINDLLTDENSDISDIGEVVETDPALTSALLRLSNSALYNLGSKVSTIDRAIAVVGMREVRSLAFGISATTTFKNIPFHLISVENFWKHSLYCAAAAQATVRIGRIRTAESMFTAGLLHDIGQPVLFSQQPELSKEALELSLYQNDGLTPHVSEREVFGFDHCAVGAALARKWNFPQALIDCIAYHNMPYSDGPASEANHVLIVHIANSLAVLTELDSLDLESAPPIDPRALDDLDLSADLIPEIVGETEQSVEGLLQLFVN